MTKTNILLAALLLGSCDNHARASADDALRRVELLEINMGRAARASSQAADRFERVEARVDELERRVR